MNIVDGLRYKIFFDWYHQVSKVTTDYKPSTFNAGFDARYYYPIFRNFIWAGRAAGDFSFGTEKMIYYLGGVDGWLMFGDNGKYDKNGEIAQMTTKKLSIIPVSAPGACCHVAECPLRLFISLHLWY